MLRKALQLPEKLKGYFSSFRKNSAVFVAENLLSRLPVTTARKASKLREFFVAGRGLLERKGGWNLAWRACLGAVFVMAFFTAGPGAVFRHSVDALWGEPEEELRLYSSSCRSVASSSAGLSAWQAIDKATGQPSVTPAGSTAFSRDNSAYISAGEDELVCGGYRMRTAADVEPAMEATTTLETAGAASTTDSQPPLMAASSSDPLPELASAPESSQELSEPGGEQASSSVAEVYDEQAPVEANASTTGDPEPGTGVETGSAVETSDEPEPSSGEESTIFDDLLEGDTSGLLGVLDTVATLLQADSYDLVGELVEFGQAVIGGHLGEAAEQAQAEQPAVTGAELLEEDRLSGVKVHLSIAELERQAEAMAGLASSTATSTAETAYLGALSMTGSTSQVAMTAGQATIWYSVSSTSAETAPGAPALSDASETELWHELAVIPLSKLIECANIESGYSCLKETAADGVNGGHLSFEAPFIAKGADIKNLRLKIGVELAEQPTADVHLDATWVTAQREAQADFSAGYYPADKIIVNGRAVDFVHTDENANENLIIKTDGRDYDGVTESEVYVSVTNVGSSTEDVKLQVHFPADRGEVRSIERLRLHEKASEFVVTKNQALPEPSFLSRAFGKDFQRKPVPEHMRAKQSSKYGYKIGAGRTQYFRIKITYPAKSSGEFWIEAEGDGKGYGLLDPWWTSQWLYKMPITIDNRGNAAALTDYQVLVEISSTTPNFFAHANSDGSDIRFLASDESAGLTFWTQYFNKASSTAQMWVKVPTVPANSTSTIYLYYGNAAAGSISDMYGTFSYSTMQDLYYVVSNNLTNASITVVSLIDNNQVQMNNGAIANLDRQATTTFLAPTATSVLRTKGPIMALITNIGNADAVVPAAFAGKQFVFPQTTGTESFARYALVARATTTVYNGATLANTTVLATGTAVTTANNITSNGTVEATAPILAYSWSNTPGYSMIGVPTTKRDLYGVRSGSNYIGHATNGTTYRIYCSGNTTVAPVAQNRGTRYTNTTCASVNNGGGNAVRITSISQPIGAIQYNDGDGAETSMFLPDTELSTEYMVPTATQYVAIACPPKAGTNILAYYNGADTFVASTSCAMTGEYPGKAFFGSTTNGVFIGQGSRIVSLSNKPFYAYFEDYTAPGTAGGDEGNLLGAVQARKYASTSPVFILGAEESLALQISGRVYSDEGQTPLLSGPVVSLAVDNRFVASTTASTSDGSFTFYYSSTTLPAAGSTTVVYLDDGTNFGATVLRYVGTDHIADIDIYQDHTVLRHDDPGPITNANLARFTGANDSNIKFSVTGGNFRSSSTQRLLVWPGDTYAPGGTVTTDPGATAAALGGDIKLASTTSTLAMNGYALSIGGDFLNLGVCTTTATQTTSFTGTANGLVIDSDSPFRNVIFNGSGGSWSFATTANLTGNLVMNNGSLTGTSSIYLNGNATGTAGTISMTAGIFRAGGTGSFGANAPWSFGSLVFGTGTVATISKIGTGTVFVADSLTISTSTTLNASSSSWTIAGSGTPFSIKGAFQAQTSTFRFTATENADIASTTYYNLEFAPSGAGNPSFTLGAGSTTVNGNLTVGTGANPVGVTAATNNAKVLVRGNVQIGAGGSYVASAVNPLTAYGSWTSNGSFVHNAGTVNFSATSTGKTIDNNVSDFNNVVFNGVAGGWSFTADTMIAGYLNMATGSLSGTADVTVAGGTATGTGSISLTGGTFVLAGSGNFGSNRAWSFYDLQFGNGAAGTTTKIGTGSTTISHNLTVAASAALNASSSLWHLVGTGTPLLVNGTLNPESSTFRFSATTSISIEAANYYNLELTPNGAGSPTYTLQPGLLSVAGILSIGTGTNPVIVSAAANNPTVDVAATFRIGTSSTYAASAVNPLLVGGNWLSGGTFVSNGGRVIFDSTSTGRTINNLASSFGSVAFNGTGGGWSFSTSTTLTGNLFMATGTLSGTQNINVLGGYATGTAGVINLTGGTFTLAGNGEFGSDSDWSFVNLVFGTTTSSNIAKIGTGTVNVATALTVATTSSLSAGSSTWNLLGASTPFLLRGSFAAETSTFRYTAVSAANISTTTYYNLELSPRAAGSPVMTMQAGTLNVLNNMYVCNGTNPVTVRASTNNTVVNVNNDILIRPNGTYVAAASSPMSVAGNWYNNGIFTHSGGVVVFTATSSGRVINNQASAYNRVIFNGIGGGWQFGTTTTLAGSLYMANGELSGTSSLQVTGHATGTNGMINLTGGTFTLTGTGNFGSNLPWQFNNLTLGSGAVGTLSKIGTGTINVAAVMTIATSTTLNASSSTWQLQGGGTPMLVRGVLVPQLSTFRYLADANTLVASTSYYNLELSPGGASNPTYTLMAGTTTAGNRLSVGDGTSSVSVTAATFNARLVVNDMDINNNGSLIASAVSSLFVNGNWQSDGMFSHNNGVVVFAATSTGKLIGNNASDYGNVIFNGRNGGWAFSTTTAIAGFLNIATGTLSGTADINLYGGTATGTGSIDLTGGNFTIMNSGNFGGTLPWSFHDLTFGSGANGTTTKFSNNTITVRNSMNLAANATLFASTSTWILAGGGDALSSAGLMLPQTSTFRFSATTSANIPAYNYYNLELTPNGATNPTYQLQAGTLAVAGNFYVGTSSVPVTVTAAAGNPLVDVNGNFRIGTSSAFIASDINPLQVAGNWTNTGAFDANGGVVVFDATSSGRTISAGGSPFGTVAFNGVGGRWTVNQHATSTGNWSLVNADSFTVAAGITLEVRGQYIRSVPGASTTWSGATLYINGTSQTLNDRFDAGDAYGTLRLGDNTDVKMWNSTSSSYIVPSTASLYSMDHGAVNGSLYIWGDYQSSAAEYWSAATDFDGTSLAGAPRQVNVRLATSSSVTISNGELQMIGTSTATTTVANQGSGTYSLTVDSSMLNARYYQLRNLDNTGLNIAGASDVASLNNGDLRLEANGASIITLAASAINQTGALFIASSSFSSSSGVTTGYNVNLDAAADYDWDFSMSTGTLAREQFDRDSDEPVGNLIWSDTPIWTPKSQNWQWFNDQTAETPAVAAAGEGIAPSSIPTGNTLKLRLTVKETAAIAGYDAKFRLQFSTSPDFSSNVYEVAEHGSSTAVWTYGNGVDNDDDAITTRVLSDSDVSGTHNESGISTTSFDVATSSASEFEFTLFNNAGINNNTYYFRAYSPQYKYVYVQTNVGETYPSLVVGSSSLATVVTGLASGTIVNGVALDVTSAPASLDFGTIQAGQAFAGAQRISISTNAESGYQLFVRQTNNFMSAAGNSIFPIDATNAAPAAWSMGTRTSTFGYHTSDATLSGANPSRFAPSNTWAQLEFSQQEVGFNPNPAGGEYVDILYRIEASNIQLGGDYSTNVEYLIVPTY